MTSFLAYVFFASSLGIFAVKNVFIRKNIRIKLYKEDILLFVLILIAVIAKVVSVLGMHTPNLSDEITHSYFAKLIVDTGELSYFYSPGLHIFVAYLSKLGGDDIVKQILYVTNFFSAYSGALVYLYVKQIFHNKIAALFSAFFFSLGIALSDLFYLAGKNSLIFAVSVLLLFLLLIGEIGKRVPLKRVVLTCIVFFATFVVHYPTAVFACIAWFSAFLISSKKSKGKLFLVLCGGILGIGLMILLGIKQSSIHPELGGVVDGTNFNFLSLPSSFFSELLQYLDFVIRDTINRVFKGYPKSLFIISLMGFIVFLSNLHKSNNKNYVLLLIWIIISNILVASIYLFSIDSILIVGRTYLILHFIPLYIFLGFFISFLYKNSHKFISSSMLFFLFTIGYVGLFTFEGKRTYDRFQAKKTYSIVRDADMRMFDWIEANTIEEEGILINGYDIIPGKILPSDSGGWITIMSGNKVSFPFWEFSSNRSFNNYYHYLELHNDLTNCESREYFLNNGYEYYFQGMIPLGETLATPSELELMGWELVHSEENVYLFKIPPCEVGN
jgi:hypothetical protein